MPLTGKVLLVGSQEGPVIWSVDDAWFDDIQKQGYLQKSVVAKTFGIDQDSASKGLTFGAVLERIKETKVKLAEQGLFKVYFEESGDTQAFIELVTAGQEAEVGLVFCDFEYFEANFGRCNRPTVAVLLDIAYAKEKDRRYGIVLLQRLLDGRRFRGDVFFWTAHTRELDDAQNEHRDDPKWWPIRFVPSVPKAGDAGAIKSFVQFFKQGLTRDFLRLLAEAVAEADKGRFTHPDFWNQVPDSFFLREIFVRHDSLSSFKALFHWDGKMAHGEGHRAIQAGVLRDVFTEAGIELTTEVSSVKLPVEPGILFVLRMVRLVDALEQERSRSLLLEVNREARSCIAKLWIPIENPRIFQAAWWQRCDRGKATGEFRKVLGFDPEILADLDPFGLGASLAEKYGTKRNFKNDDPTSIVRVPLVTPDFDVDRRRVGLVWNFSEGGDRE